MAVPTILRVRRVDNQTGPLLVNVRTKGSGNLRNFKLIAFDREQQHLYHGSVKESNSQSFQSSNYSGDLQEWKAILAFVLLHDRPAGTLPEYLQAVEMIADINDSTVTLTIRKNIDGITQKMGMIQLQEDDEREEVDVVAWADAAAAASDDLRDQLQNLQASITSQQEQVTNLTTQLDALVNAKKEHEDEVLTKFAATLNAKKSKIRALQHVIGNAGIDVEPADAVDRNRRENSKDAGSSRAGKRKLKASSGTLESLEDDEDADVAEVGEDQGEETEQAHATPEESGADTDEALSEGEDASAAPALSRTRHRVAGGGDDPGVASETYPSDEDMHDGLARPRDLPYARERELMKTVKGLTGLVNDEDDETDEDEL